MSSPLLSVVICTHNPRAAFLARTIAALREQSPPRSDWELLVVDNASAPPVASTLDVSWHPAARIISEPKIGVAWARVRGIAEARGELILFVDDDNLLAPDYFARVVEIAAAWPQLGLWGCGNYEPEWETPPAPHLTDYLSCLAVHRAPRDRWSNQLFDYPATPATAGMCVRTTVARHYATEFANNPRRRALGRSGGGLGACEDHDLAFTAIPLGHGIGVFTSLRMIHLMPTARVQESYLLRLVEGHSYSAVLLHSLWDPAMKPPRSGLLAQLREFRLRRALDPLALRFHNARRRGERRAWAELAAPPP